MKQLLFTFIIAVFVYSCTTVTALRKMHSEGASFEQWSNGNKSVVFIPMVHVGKPQFYANVKRVIDSLKGNGYIVYYEGVKKVYPEDFLGRDTFRRKLRKFTGFMFDSMSYVQVLHDNGVFKKMIDQPSYQLLGIDQDDRQIDITLGELINAYENKYGEILLERGDFQMPLEKRNVLPKTLQLPREKVMDVILNYRNKHLMNAIDKSGDRNIVVVYGLMHMKGTFEELSRINSSWRKTN